jgi:hypothetical protein
LESSGVEAAAGGCGVDILLSGPVDGCATPGALPSLDASAGCVALPSAAFGSLVATGGFDSSEKSILYVMKTPTQSTATSATSPAINPRRRGVPGDGTPGAAVGAGAGAYVAAASRCVLEDDAGAGAGLGAAAAALGAALIPVATAAGAGEAATAGRVVPHCTQNFAVAWVS